MDPNKGCSVTMVADEEGCCSIPITQRPSDQGRLRAEYELESASSIRSLPPSSWLHRRRALYTKLGRGKNTTSYNMNNNTTYIVDKMNTVYLLPLINKPTCIASHCHSIIDNIYANSIDKDITSSVVIADISDHYYY